MPNYLEGLPEASPQMQVNPQFEAVLRALSARSGQDWTKLTERITPEEVVEMRRQERRARRKKRKKRVSNRLVDRLVKNYVPFAAAGAAVPESHIPYTAIPQNAFQQIRQLDPKLQTKGYWPANIVESMGPREKLMFARLVEMQKQGKGQTGKTNKFEETRPQASSVEELRRIYDEKQRQQQAALAGEEYGF